MPRSLSENEFATEARSRLLEVYGTDYPDPYQSPFTEKMAWRRILCPYTYVPDLAFLTLISTFAEARGEEGFFLTVTGRPAKTEQDKVQNYHWYIPYSKIDTYEEAIGIYSNLPTIIYSPNASWGIISDYEGMGVFGATNDFGRKIEHLLPNPSKDALEFIDLFKWYRSRVDKGERQVEFSWVPVLLEHVYGKKLAEEFLRASSWYQ